MAIGAREETGRLPLAERLRGLFARRTRGAETAELTVFTRQLFARGAGYVESLADEEAAALVLSAFRFFAAPGPDLRVRIVTPTYATEGWDAPVTLIETVMPDRAFIVDTIRCRLAAAGVAVETLLHPIFAARRDPHGRLEVLGPPEGGEPRESFTHVAVAGTADDAARTRLERDVRAALEDVRLVTDDFGAMVSRAQAIAAELDALARARAGQRAAAAMAVADVLRWLVDGAFVFLGYREYGLTTLGAATMLQLRPNSGLGLLRREDRSAFRHARRVDELPDWVRARLLGDELFTAAKTAALAPVHRLAPMDDVAVHEVDADGRVVGVRRFIGLFTSKATAEEAAEVPLLRRRLRQLLAAERVVPGSHDHKEIVAAFNALPKTELFAARQGELRAEIATVLAAARSSELAVSVHGGPDTPRVAVLVVMPRARFSSDARRRLRDVLTARLGRRLLEDHLVLGESEAALLHFAFAPGPSALPPPDVVAAAVAATVRTWEEALGDLLVTRHGDAVGERLAARWVGSFSEGYRAEVPVEQAAEDVAVLDAVERDGGVRIVLRPGRGVPDTTELRFYLPGEPLVLSEFMPVLENLRLRALGEAQVVVAPPDGARIAMQSFFVHDRAGRPLDVAAVGPRLTEALLALRTGAAENDVLNGLVLEAGLDWRAVDALRTYAGYAAQISIATRALVLTTLADHPDSARLLYECFAARFRPDDADDWATLERGFLESVDRVQSLREDVLLRALLDLVRATVRTSFFGQTPRPWIALKIRAADVAQVPAPRPLYEIWVHAPTVEGVHVRAGKIARGGIRWSDRPDDFRTEIVALMRTQTVKNAIIVPTGAKGGFVPKRGTPALEAYRTFVRALLDLTDNVVAGRVVHPRGLVVHDEEDPYLVVAADKGTAAFSDAANACAAEFGYWLGDAFASGGSHGYDHKALGITARGAWECVRTHFHTLGIDADTAPLAVAGIGDPSGDVFGNGMLRSPHLRLRAAFNHVHVFLDPAPDPAQSFAERERLFRAGLAWDAYDPAVLSGGGAVVPRAAKRVVLSPEAQAMLGLPEPTVSGEQLVQAVLTLDADLLFNGGIGTYVRASTEREVDVQDPANDAARVPAPALRAKVVAEGGNLGFTQRARIEYALGGGRINTDAIDNSAGVDLSDHEVNLKILLRAPAEDGLLSDAARDALLVEVRDDVAARVLAHNRAQSRLLSVDQVRSRRRLLDFREAIGDLERTGGLDRLGEALPDGDALRARRGTFLGLTRPELAVVAAYVKIALQRDILASALPDDPLAEPYLLGYFPAAVVERHPGAVRSHPLRREIIATELANALTDGVGTTFVSRVRRETGASTAEVVRAWTIAWALIDGPRLGYETTAGGFPAETDTLCALALERTCERVTVWLVAHTDATRSAAAIAAELGAAVGRVRSRLPEWITDAEAESFQRLRSELELAGLSRGLARDLATAEWITGALDVVTVARETGADPEAVAARYYALGQKIDFAWLWARIAEAGEVDRWHQRAGTGLSEDLLRARRRLTRLAVEGTEPLGPRALAGIDDLIRDVRTAPRVPLAALAVIVREIRRAAESG